MKPKYSSRRTFNVSAKLLEDLQLMTASKAKTLEWAVNTARMKPNILGEALNNRVLNPCGESSLPITVGVTQDTHETINDLAQKTRLPAEQVIRLCLEYFFTYL